MLLSCTLLPMPFVGYTARTCADRRWIRPEAALSEMCIYPIVTSFITDTWV